MHSAAPYRPRVSPEHPFTQLKYTKAYTICLPFMYANFPRYPGSSRAAAVRELYQSVILQPSSTKSTTPAR